MRAKVTAAQIRNLPLQPGTGSAHGDLRLVGFLDRPFRTFEITQPRFGRRKPLGGASEQLDAQIILKLGDLSWRRLVGRREAAGPLPRKIRSRRLEPCTPQWQMTGFTVQEPSLGPKWIDLLKEVAPQLTRIAVFPLVRRCRGQVWGESSTGSSPRTGRG